MKSKLLVSFSGGETSAFMTQWLVMNKSDEYEIIIVFANTGEENEETLQFVHNCEQHFGWNVVWVECVTNPVHGKGVSAKVVTFETAARNGEPFEGLIAKHGIPNNAAPFCSKELKKRTIRAYARSLGWAPKDYQVAIGIRTDEFDRISEEKEKENLFYPLISLFPTTKIDVNRYWRDMPFRLNLKGYQGNCKVCWKKSLRKLLTLAKEEPKLFDNFAKWEEKYGTFIPESRQHNDKITIPIRFFRNNLSVQDILTMSQTSFEPAKDDSINYTLYVQTELFGHDLDLSNGCVESCEVF